MHFVNLCLIYNLLIIRKLIINESNDTYIECYVTMHVDRVERKALNVLVEFISSDMFSKK